MKDEDCEFDAMAYEKLVGFAEAKMNEDGRHWRALLTDAKVALAELRQANKFSPLVPSIQVLLGWLMLFQGWWISSIACFVVAILIVYSDRYCLRKCERKGVDLIEDIKEKMRQLGISE